MLVWIIIAGTLVVVLYCFLGIVPFLVTLLRKLLGIPAKASKGQSREYYPIRQEEGTEDRSNESRDDETSEESGYESSALQDEEDEE